MRNAKVNRGGATPYTKESLPSEFKRKPDTEYVLNMSYGKDSAGCLGAIKILGLPLDRVIHAEVWATDDIPAELPPMVEFKDKVDKYIEEEFGIKVERLYAMENENKLTYERQFYKKYKKGKHVGNNYGFPMVRGAWCNSRLKVDALDMARKSNSNKVVNYLGIAVDEPKRLARLDGVTKISPLELIGWTEEDAKNWCIKNDLLSPIYTDITNRGGCWFCHNQTIDQLRLLRKEYPYLWNLLLKWDADSKVSFNPNGRTVHDYDRRFDAEEKGLVPTDKKFRWKALDNLEKD